jgi:hypothetical protein
MNLELIKAMTNGELRELFMESSDPQIYIPKGLTHTQSLEVMYATATEIATRNNKPIVPITLDRNSLLVQTGIVKMPEPLVYKGHSKKRRFSHKYFLVVDGKEHLMSRTLFHKEIEKLIGSEEWNRRRYNKHGYHPIVNFANRQQDLKSKDAKFTWQYKGHTIIARCHAEPLKGDPI